MSIQIIAAERVPATPWANGGGLTRELFTWPPASSGAAGWSLRISLAEISRDGLFSPFPGVERWFVVVDGAGVVLTLGGQRHVLDRRSPPLHFDGADPPHCSLQDRASRDLNLMVRRGSGRATMQAVRHDDEWISAAPLRAVFAAEPMTLQIDDADAAVLPAFALAVSPHAARQRWRVRAETDTPAAWWLGFEPAPR